MRVFYTLSLSIKLFKVIVGGGPTGTEFCGELSDFIKGSIKGMYPHLYRYAKVHIIDAAPVLLGPFRDQTISDYRARIILTTFQP